MRKIINLIEIQKHALHGILAFSVSQWTVSTEVNYYKIDKLHQRLTLYGPKKTLRKYLTDLNNFLAVS